MSGAARAQPVPPQPLPAPQLRLAPALQPPPRGEAANRLPIVVEADEVHGRPDLETIAEGPAAS